MTSASARTHPRSRRVPTHTSDGMTIKDIVDQSIREGLRREITPSVGIHFMKFTGKFNLVKISEQAQYFTKWLNRAYEGALK